MDLNAGPGLFGVNTFLLLSVIAQPRQERERVLYDESWRMIAEHCETDLFSCKFYSPKTQYIQEQFPAGTTFPYIRTEIGAIIAASYSGIVNQQENDST